MLDLTSSSALPWGLALIALTLIAHFFTRLHFQRTLLKDLPGPPRSYLFGTLLSMAKVFATQPVNAAPQSTMQALKQHYGLGDLFYIDSWPLGPGMMILSDVDVYNEIIIKTPHRKHPLTDWFMRNFGGPG